VFPKKVVGSVVGFGGMAGAIGGMFMTLVVGGLLQATHTYVPLFVIAGLMHPIALVIIAILAGREFKQVDIDVSIKPGPSANLRIVGSVVALAGVALLGVVTANWSLLVQRSLSAAVQGATASFGVAFLGSALLYASRDQRPVGERT
jgi:hypothetical protein